MNNLEYFLDILDISLHVPFFLCKMDVIYWILYLNLVLNPCFVLFWTHLSEWGTAFTHPSVKTLASCFLLLCSRWTLFGAVSLTHCSSPPPVGPERIRIQHHCLLRLVWRSGPQSVPAAWNHHHVVFSCLLQVTPSCENAKLPRPRSARLVVTLNVQSSERLKFYFPIVIAPAPLSFA